MSLTDKAGCPVTLEYVKAPTYDGPLRKRVKNVGLGTPLKIRKRFTEALEKVDDPFHVATMLETAELMLFVQREHNLVQKDLAHICLATREHVSNFLNGKTPLTVRSCLSYQRHLADWLALSPEERLMWPHVDLAALYKREETR